jgi:hypothetical protein
MPIPLRKSNKGWCQSWFYLRNDDAAPLLVFSSHLIEEVLDEWRYGPIATEQQ